MKAAILEKIGAPLRVSDIRLPKTLQHGRVLVKVLCTGICGSQLQEIDGIKGDSAHLPHLLGHEGCGIVEGVRTDSYKFKIGDKVVMHWRKGSGADVVGGTYGGIRSGPITTFSEYSIVSENRLTKIDDDVPNDFAALLGCALSTALAIVEKETQNDQCIIVIGCGGVGLALILVSKMISSFVAGFDRVKSKRALVEALGAQWITRMVKADVLIDTIGGYRDYVSRGKYVSLQDGGTSAGGFDPPKDIPRYVQMWRDGLLNDYPKIVTHRISLDQINEGIQLMREGKAGRVMIEMNQ
jgi:Zn-dependent alcohol dehydrogenase